MSKGRLLGQILKKLESKGILAMVHIQRNKCWIMVHDQAGYSHASIADYVEKMYGGRIDVLVPRQPYVRRPTPTAHIS